MSRFFSSFMMDAMRWAWVGSSFVDCYCCCRFVCLTVVYHVLDTRTIPTIRNVCRNWYKLYPFLHVHWSINRSYQNLNFWMNFTEVENVVLILRLVCFFVVKYTTTTLFTRCYRRRFILDEHTWGALPVPLKNLIYLQKV